MRRLTNRYCSECLRTRKFLNLRDRTICQYCSKILWRRTDPVARRDRHPEPVPLRRQRRMVETA